MGVAAKRCVKLATDYKSNSSKHTAWLIFIQLNLTVFCKTKFTEMQLIQLLLHGKTRPKCGKQLSKLNEK